MSSTRTIEDSGDLPWMVMVHGMSQDHRIFSAQVAAFRATHRILLVDLPGHGLSAAIGGPYGHEEFADHVAGAMRGRGVTAARLWGTHTGATVGLLVAADAPELIGALILEGPVVPGCNPPVVTETIARARATVRELGIDAARDEWWRTSCWFAAIRADPIGKRAAAHHAIVAAFGGRPWADDAAPRLVARVEARLATISAPALVYNGAEDHTDFLTAATEIDGLLAKGTRALIPGAGGFPAWERPNEVNAVVNRFLRTLGAVGA
ncbi:alpha/beta hydrolase [Sphingomonas sp.]|uniref:alpha/beta fold hydrolase n=1 Tax=Sphingomonas sp. TaxID=28214 RepID=UPI0025ED9619|nr:alpha/beta hydrolase [Sphingomonas sp.]